MKPIFQKIEMEAKDMQDLRDDKGHAEIVTFFAEKLCRIFNADENVIIPAAILHDIGYYGMDRQLLRDMMDKKLPKDQEEKIKEEHMINGANFAERILKKVNYNSNLIQKIIDLIKRHDREIPCLSIEEKVLRDADKLWRYSKKGFYVDIKRRNCKPLEGYEKLKNNFNKENYFQTQEAKKIAEKELEKRKNKIYQILKK